MNDETPSEKLSGSIFERIKDFFTAAWTSFWEIDPLVLIPFGSSLGTALSEKFEESIAGHLERALNTQLVTMDVPDYVKTIIQTIVKDKDYGSLLLGYYTLAQYYLKYLGGHADVAAELSSHEWRAAYQPTLPDISSLILNLFRNPAKLSETTTNLRKLGFNDASIEVLMKASKSVHSFDELKNLFLRGEISEVDLNQGFKNFGFSDTEIGNLKKLFYPIPSYPDLIRMAVREAFLPEYIEEYGLMAEYPADFELWAKKQGLTSDWCKKYWASHWELPSILRGYEMLHRNVIDSEDLDKLFMAVDIMPFWRDKLKAISYHPLTRVDVRRVFRMGIIDREQVKRTYLDLGYNEEKAEWLTKYTEMEQSEPERDLTKAEVLSAYSKDIINESLCRDMLGELGYDENEVEILVSTRDYQDTKDIKNREIARIKKYYLAGAYTDNQAISELGKLNLIGAEQTSLMHLWDSEKLAKLRMPSKKDLDSLYQGAIIDSSVYFETMKQLGYQTQHIQWFIKLLDKAKK